LQETEAQPSGLRNRIGFTPSDAQTETVGALGATHVGASHYHARPWAKISLLRRCGHKSALSIPRSRQGEFARRGLWDPAEDFLRLHQRIPHRFDGLVQFLELLFIQGIVGNTKSAKHNP
jgi:hypothetical protein